MLLPQCPSDSTKVILKGLEMSTSPEAVSERGTLKPRPRLRRREGIPRSAPCLACTGSNKSRSNFSPALRRAGFPGRCSARAPQAGASPTRPRARAGPSGAPRREPDPHPGQTRPVARRRPGRVSTSRPPRLPPNFVQL